MDRLCDFYSRLGLLYHTAVVRKTYRIRENIHEIYGKIREKHTRWKTSVVFHSTANVFLQIMALSIRDISLEDATAKVLLQIAILHSKHECFLVYGIKQVLFDWLPTHT